MSRIGLKPVKLGKGVTVTPSKDAVTVKGPKGTLTLSLPPSIVVKVAGDTCTVERQGEEKHVRSCHGTVRATLANHAQGVVTPYSKTLDIQGVGYQAAMKGKKLGLKVGFANEILLDVPAGIQVDLPSNTRVIVSGADKQMVGQFAAEIRATRPPEPYNGKGIRYENERVERKAGKTFTSGG
jgi:large subunit ribosomal protein L6